MFNSARLKLTGWYLVIIMSISLLFSLAIFQILGSEIEFNYNRLMERFNAQSQLIPDFERPNPPSYSLVEASKDRVKLTLFYINLIILIISASAGYFLAGRTLRPIQEMVDEQNRFITDASHELRTPLTSLKTSIEVALRDKNLDFKQAKGLLKSNLDDVDNLKSLSDNLLILTSSQATRRRTKQDNVSVVEVVDKAAEIIEKTAKVRQINIEKKVQETNWEGDKDELTRLLVIFLDNAIKYSPAKSTVELRVSKFDHNLRISIQDYGMGISQEDLPFIFDRFFRADKSRSKTSGYGLGLSIAKKIIDSYGGSVEIDSKINSGTTFRIDLPLKQSNRLAVV